MNRARLPSLALPFLLLGGLGCPTEPEPLDPPGPTPGVQVEQWCAAGLGGPAGSQEPAHGLAAAHATGRLFGPTADWLAADAALVELLSEVPADDPVLPERLAELLPDSCAVAAISDVLSEATVELVDGVAVVQPGQGVPTLPDGTEAVVIDLRTLAPGADLAGAVGLALAEDVSLGSRTLREFKGMPEQDDGWTHYESQLVTQTLSVSATGTRELPLAFLTPTRLSPEAARLVGGLRLAERATIIGHDVLTAVAESVWSPVGASGLLVRTVSLEMQQVPWPDRIPADVSTETPEYYVAEADTLEFAAMEPTFNRSAMVPYDRTGWDWLTADTTLELGEMRAGLLIAWGTLDRFFPFFDLVDRGIDDELLAGLTGVESVPAGDRRGYMEVLGRFMHELHDGHGFYSDWAGDWPSGYLIVQIQQVDGEPVVRTSDHEGIEAGDTITHINGVPAGDWYDEAMARYSAASDGYRFVLATDELKEVWGTTELGLRAPDGTERTLTTTGRPYDDRDAVAWGGSLRPSGWLGDLGAPDTYFLNMAGDVSPDEDAVYDAAVAAITGLEEGQSLVLDMRDYPALNYYELERHLHEEPYTTPEFWFPTWTGPEDFALVEDSWSFTPAAQVWTGPIVVLMSNKSVSSAENVAQMLEYLPNVTVVGQQSASTNGTITSFWLPGNFSLTFTGMRLRNPDGSEFHGIGVVPDIEVTPTAQAFAAGEDPELQAAADFLSTAATTAR